LSRKREAQAHRDYWSLRVHWAPFQGPDRLRSVKLAGCAPDEPHIWTQFQLKPWKPALKPVKASTEHVELSQRVFHCPWTGWEFAFWALAPRAYRISREQSAHAEWVWLVLDGDNGRGVHHALVDLDTSDVLWWDRNCGHYVQGSEEVAATA